MVHYKSKILNFLLIVFSLLGYLEWGGGRHAYLYEAEGEVLSKIFTNPAAVMHPLTVLPMAGQILLLITLFQKQPGKMLTYISIGGLGLLLAFMLLAGIISMNLKIILSVVPFFILAAITIKHHRRMQQHFPEPGS